MVQFQHGWQLEQYLDELGELVVGDSCWVVVLGDLDMGELDIRKVHKKRGSRMSPDFN